ncbi:hypothetical protein HK100_005521 [Physocladia obscura]|uniref:Uncharacterized protein n=1 Tax=Physocladia obscura TaxID=109957 RepID=A0AAD5XIU2_9FUNG|nr:hypothetical protein HK100_005521 [Physocladia obscura]
MRSTVFCRRRAIMSLVSGLWGGSVNSTRSASTVPQFMAFDILKSDSSKISSSTQYPSPIWPCRADVHAALFEDHSGASTGGLGAGKAGNNSSSSSSTGNESWIHNGPNQSEILRAQYTTASLLNTPIVMRSLAQWAVFNLGDEDH